LQPAGLAHTRHTRTEPSVPNYRDRPDFWIALHKVALEVHRELIEGSEPVEDWARRHHLLDDRGRVPQWIIEGAEAERKAAYGVFRPFQIVAGHRVEGDTGPEHLMIHYERLFNPWWSSPARLKKDIMRDLEAAVDAELSRVESSRPGRVTAKDPDHFRMFVEFQINARTVRELAPEPDKHAAIRKVLSSVAARLGIALRRNPPGRPRRTSPKL
jgi:hypothetical protein